MRPSFDIAMLFRTDKVHFRRPAEIFIIRLRPESGDFIAIPIIKNYDRTMLYTDIRCSGKNAFDFHRGGRSGYVHVGNILAEQIIPDRSAYKVSLIPGSFDLFQYRCRF
ncbi:Uncharacterised protein [Mycobacteroides abscessus subsp. abscessus]|nr:Uncharacterised protein [Mycobacteroides abscessus subsp. abscessus]